MKGLEFGLLEVKPRATASMAETRAIATPVFFLCGIRALIVLRSREYECRCYWLLVHYQSNEEHELQNEGGEIDETSEHVMSCQGPSVCPGAVKLADFT